MNTWATWAETEMPAALPCHPAMPPCHAALPCCPTEAELLHRGDRRVVCSDSLRDESQAGCSSGLPSPQSRAASLNNCDHAWWHSLAQGRGVCYAHIRPGSPLSLYAPGSPDTRTLWGLSSLCLQHALLLVLTLDSLQGTATASFLKT